MIDWVLTKLTRLREELTQGQVIIADLDRSRQEMERTIGRLEGAIIVLEDLLGAAADLSPEDEEPTDCQNRQQPHSPPL